MRKAKYACDDIYDPGQQMYGTILDDLQPRVWLTDLPNGARSFARANPRRAELYNLIVLDWINGIIAAENIADSQLRAARLAVMGAFELSNLTHRGSEWVGAFRSALEQRQELDADEEPIAGLRTF